MKKLAIALLFTSLSTGLFAQNIAVTEKPESFETIGVQTGFYVQVPYAKIDDIEKIVKSELKKWKGKLSTKEGIFIDDANVKSVSENTFDVYGKIVLEAGGQVALVFAVDLGGSFVKAEEHPHIHRELKKLIHDIAVESSKDAVKEEVKLQEKVIKEKNKEHDKLVSDKEKLEKDIENYQKKINEAKLEIETNVANQTKKTEEITSEENKLKEINTKLTTIK